MKPFVINGVSGPTVIPDNLSQEAVKYGIHVLVDTSTEGCVITLPTITAYDCPITIIDSEANASTNNIQISSSNELEGNVMDIEINTDGDAAVFTKAGNRWNVEFSTTQRAAVRPMTIGSMYASQAGVNAPVVSPVEALTGIVFTPSYVSTGVYKLTADADLPSVVLVRCGNGLANVLIAGKKTAAREITLNCYSAGTLSDGKMADIFIEIICPITL